MRNRWWVAPGVAAAAALLAACGSSSASGTASSASSSSAKAAASSAPASSAPAAAAATPSDSAVGLMTASTSKGTVLVTAQGYTVYMFAIDTPTMSKCNATCLQFWPALTGMPTAAAGSNLTGKFGTIKGTGGITQATYNGHPLYRFVDDKKPGEVNGNGVNTSGGLWYALTPAGVKLTAAKVSKPAASSSSSSAGSSGGYGY